MSLCILNSRLTWSCNAIICIWKVVEEFLSRYLFILPFIEGSQCLQENFEESLSNRPGLSASKHLSAHHS